MLNYPPGAIMLTTMKHDRGILGIASKLIREGEKLIYKEARFTHSAIIGYGNLIVEATIGGVQESEADKYIGKGHITKILIPDWLDDKAAAKIVREARNYIGRPYGYIDLPIYLADLALMEITGRRGIITRVLNRAYLIVCSELVARSYIIVPFKFKRYKKKKTIDLAPSSVTPTDIYLTAKREGWAIEEA